MTADKTIPMTNVLIRANDIVKARGKIYGSPLDDFTRTAKIWSGILGIDVRPEQVALCMMGLKMSRLSQTPDHDDSNLDIAGYSWCYEQCINGDKDENQTELDFQKVVGESHGQVPLKEPTRTREVCGYCGSDEHSDSQCAYHRHT